MRFQDWGGANHDAAGPQEAELEGIIELAKPAAYIVVEKYLGFSYVPMANAMKEKYSCIRHIFVDSESGDISGMIAETYGENGAFPAVDGYETAVLLLSGGTTGFETDSAHPYGLYV